MDILIEILLEIYMELMLLVVPERNVTKRTRRLATVLVVCVIAALAALVIWGLVLIVDHGNMMGVLPITAAALISLAQIIAGFVLYKKHH